MVKELRKHMKWVGKYSIYKNVEERKLKIGWGLLIPPPVQINNDFYDVVIVVVVDCGF